MKINCEVSQFFLLRTGISGSPVRCNQYTQLASWASLWPHTVLLRGDWKKGKVREKLGINWTNFYSRPANVNWRSIGVISGVDSARRKRSVCGRVSPLMDIHLDFKCGQAGNWTELTRTADVTEMSKKFDIVNADELQCRDATGQNDKITIYLNFVGVLVLSEDSSL